MAATLNSFLGNLDKIPMYIDECKRLKIDILKPDINKSYTKFTVDNGKIRFGLGSIKNVGISAVNAIVKEREENGLYESFTDFCERMKNEAVNKKCIESLIRAGAFDEFEQTRSTLLASFETILDTIQETERKSFAGQVTMFDLAMPEENIKELQYSFNVQKEFSEKDLLSMEKEMLGIYISGHPLEKLRVQIERETNVNSLKLKELANLQSTVLDEGEFIARKNEYKDGQFVKYAGIITSVKKKYTKNNTIMAFVTVEDLYGTVEIIVFENCYQDSSKYLVEESIVMVEGRLSIREDDEPKIVARTIKPFGDNKKRILTIDINGMEEREKDRLRGIIRYFCGDRNNTPVQIMEDGDLKPCGAIYLTDEILKEIEEAIGKERIEI